MCRGGRLIADFVAGTAARPGLPEELDEHLTTTVDGLWVVWAYKLALPVGALFVALSGRVLALEWAGEGVLWRAERQTVVRIERSARFDRTAPAPGKRRYPGDPDGRPAVLPAATPRGSGPVRLNLPVSCPVLPVCHDDAGWCAGSSRS